jgi:catechol 2,3-dioxygenase-like lactoylglutathione lyase family enzyme
MKIAMTSMYVNDPNEAFRFYTEILGFSERLHIPEALLAIVASPEEPDGTGLLLEPNDTPIASTYQQQRYDGGFPVIVLGTSDIRGDYARLQGVGVTFRKEPTVADYGSEAVFEDGCGNLIQLLQV